MGNIFYTPDISGDSYVLDEQESRHCIKVLRYSVGEVLTLIDGKGFWYKASIVDPNSKRCKIKIIHKEEEQIKRLHGIHIAIAPTKNIDRFEWFLEKSVELGIDEISPILCDHSERKNVNDERLEKIMVAAIKQSMKAKLPRLNKMINFETLISLDRGNNRFIAHCSTGSKVHLLHAAKPKTKSLVLIGPEGDFSDHEIEVAKMNNFKEISLGNSRLRTETAGVAACHILNLINE